MERGLIALGLLGFWVWGLFLIIGVSPFHKDDKQTATSTQSQTAQTTNPKTKQECIAAGYNEKPITDDNGAIVGRKLCQEDGSTKVDPLIGEGADAIYKSVSDNQTCSIKGNISYNTGEKIYHVPGQRYYAATNIDTAYGEKMFCSEQEAINAGWRKAYE